MASQGQISGSGFAQTNTMASLAMDATHLGLISPGSGRDRAMQTSVPCIASGIPPVRRSPLEISHRRHLKALSGVRRSARPLCRMPLVSTIVRCSAGKPAAMRTRETAILAAPAPIMEIFTGLLGFADDFQGVHQSSQRDGGGSLLIVMPDGGVQLLTQPLQDIKAFGLGD